MNELATISNTEQDSEVGLQEELIAIVKGETITTLPKDLYIPPDALEVFLETFEGPLDLLLYLIKKQNLDILDIPIAEITRQYMDYISLMQEMRFELAAEYLVMAAMLAEIKSRLLLPRQATHAEEEEDPRAELARRLQEYERFKHAAEELDELPRIGRDTFTASAKAPPMHIARPLPQVALKDLLWAFKDAVERAKLNARHHVQLEPLSVRERMSQILVRLEPDKFFPFSAFFAASEGRLAVVVTFIAMLELIKGAAIEVVQTEPYSPIYIKAMVS